MSEENTNQALPPSEPIVNAEQPVNNEAPIENNTEAPAVVEEVKTVSQEDFNKLYFKLKQAERDLAAKDTTPEPVKAPTEAKPELTLEQFDFDDDAYNHALIERKAGEMVEKKFADMQSQQTQQTQADALKQAGDKFNEKAVAYAATNPGYNDAITAAGAVQYPPPVNEVLMTSEFGPQLDHQLLANPALLQEISTMTPTQAIMRMGQLEATLQTNINQKPQVSSAPAPIENVTGASRATSNYAIDENLSMEEYFAKHKEEQLRKAGR